MTDKEKWEDKDPFEQAKIRATAPIVRIKKRLARQIIARIIKKELANVE